MSKNTQFEGERRKKVPKMNEMVAKEIKKDRKQMNQAMKKACHQLQCKLSHDQIWKQTFIITSMTPLLQIPYEKLIQCSQLSGFSKEECLQIINKVQFLRVYKRKSGEQYVRIEYSLRQRIVMVTGFTRGFIEDYLADLQRYMKGTLKIVGQTPFWLAIAAESPQEALYLKKQLRSSKVAFDMNSDSCYREAKRRIRIIILEQDFHTLLVDAMIEQKINAFKKAVKEGSTLGGVVYKPIQFGVCAKADLEEEDQYQSQSTSLNSDLYSLEKASLQGLIQTSQQGIQSETNIDCKSIYTVNASHAQEIYQLLQPKAHQDNLDNSFQLPKQYFVQQQFQNSIQHNINAVFQQHVVSKQQIDKNHLQRQNQHRNTQQINQQYSPQQHSNQQYSVISFDKMLNLKKYAQLVIKQQNYWNLPNEIKRQNKKKRSRDLFYTCLCRQKKQKCL